METKICTKCGKELPATTEHFRRAQGGVYGLRGGCKECDSQYNEVNKEILIEKRKQYYQDNKAIFKARKKKYRQDNAEMCTKSNRRYRQSHLVECNIHGQEYFARKQGVPYSFTKAQWEDVKQYFNNSCCYCGEEVKLEQEHFIALSKGGEYTHNNIIPACQFCNNSKKDRDFFVWYPKYKDYNEKREKIILEFLNYKDKIQQITMTI